MKRIGILRGGTDKNYTASLKKGGEIIAHIHENLAEKYKPVDLLIDREGVWHLGGVPIVPHDLHHKVDLVWNASHPSSDVILQNFSIPVVRRAALGEVIDSNKDILREHLKTLGARMPRSVILPLYQIDFDGPRERYLITKAKEVHSKFGAPWTVRPLTAGSGMGIHVAKTFEQLMNAIDDGISHKVGILVEEFILGQPGAIHTVRGFRGEDVYTFPPRNFSQVEKEKIISLAKELHALLGAEHYLKSDFIMTRPGTIYITDVSFSPDLREGSHFYDACEALGAGVHHVVEHILESY